jgi:hypothetical protein
LPFALEEDERKALEKSASSVREVMKMCEEYFYRGDRSWRHGVCFIDPDNGQSKDGEVVSLLPLSHRPLLLLLRFLCSTYVMAQLSPCVLRFAMNHLANHLNAVPACIFSNAQEIRLGQPYTSNADVYSLGWVLFELCTLQRVFIG